MRKDRSDDVIKDMGNKAIHKILEDGLTVKNLARVIKIKARYIYFKMLSPEKQLKILLGVNEKDKEDEN
ncbi:MAG: hypothetical protein IKW59_06420 [Clostridia bacterium]|nr:hypothetical protein [Clostridia bacterium]